MVITPCLPSQALGAAVLLELPLVPSQPVCSCRPCRWRRLRSFLQSSTFPGTSHQFSLQAAGSSLRHDGSVDLTLQTNTADQRKLEGKIERVYPESQAEHVDFQAFDAACRYAKQT